MASERQLEEPLEIEPTRIPRAVDRVAEADVLPAEHRVGLDAGRVDARGPQFGSKAITRAVLLGRDPGMSVPRLPD